MNDHSRCPLCDCDGWPSFVHIDGFAAICGTSWNSRDNEPRQSEQCRIIAELKIENTLLRLGVAA